MSFYNFERLIQLLEEERQKYKKDFLNTKDHEKNRAAIVISNALTKETQHIKEIMENMK